MNKKIFLFLLLLLPSFGMKAQISVVDTSETLQSDSIDRLRLKVQYELAYVKDSTDEKQLKEPLKETLMLEIGQKVSKCYSYTVYLRDSTLFADFTSGASQETINEHARAFGNGNITYQIYKNYPTGKVTTTDRIVTTNILCEEKNDRPQWQLLPDTATVLSYPCRKGVCTFKGRSYTAWYTLDIPVSEGPWKLYGLPGLILKATDNRGHFTFTCTGLEQGKKDSPILINTKKRERLSRKELNKMYERMMKDPVGFVAATSPNVIFKMHDANGNPVKNYSLPYNPIELSE